MNREDWLRAAAERLAPWFDRRGFPLPKIRIAIGFTSHGARGRAIGQAWSDKSSADHTWEIFIKPDQSDPLTVLAILAHELIHTAVGIEAGHKGPFYRLARDLGLEGKMTATVPGPRFVEMAQPILADLGPLPHARLNDATSTGPKKQRARLLKAVCPECGYTVRVTRKWVDEVGAPHCPDHGAMDVDEPEEGEGGE